MGYLIIGKLKILLVNLFVRLYYLNKFLLSIKMIL